MLSVNAIRASPSSIESFLSLNVPPSLPTLPPLPPRTWFAKLERAWPSSSNCYTRRSANVPKAVLRCICTCVISHSSCCFFSAISHRPTFFLWESASLFFHFFALCSATACGALARLFACVCVSSCVLDVRRGREARGGSQHNQGSENKRQQKSVCVDLRHARVRFVKAITIASFSFLSPPSTQS